MKRLSRRTGWCLLGIAALVLAVSSTGWATSADPGAKASQEPSLLRITDLQYVGAFRLPARKCGQSDLNYSEGPIAWNPDRQPLFIVGRAHQQAIAEFAIPELVDSTVLAQLNMADDPLQPFARILDRAAGGDPEGNNRIFQTPFVGPSHKLGGKTGFLGAVGSSLALRA